MKNAFFYFIIFPFYGVIQAIKNYRLSWAKDMVWLFVVFFGYTMNRPERADSSRYVAKLQRMYEEPIDWSTFINSLFSADRDGNVTFDLYQPLLTNLVSLFTDNGSVLFALFGLVYGYFYSRNIWFLLDEVKKRKNSWSLWLLVVVFISVIGFWELNGVRMWTAAHVFFYGAYMVIRKENKKGYIFVIASAFIHFSFALPIVVFFAFMLTNISFRILYFIFIVSFFINSISASQVGAFLQGVLPEVLLPKLKSYTSDVYVEVVDAMQEDKNWYIKFLGKVLNYSIAFLFTIIYFSKSKSYFIDKSFIKFMGFTLLFLTVGNLMSTIPSGGRYLLIAQLFGVAVIVLYYLKFNSVLFQRSVYICSPFLLFFIVVSIRKSFDTLSIMTLFTNPILATILDTPIPLIDLIK